MSIGCSLIASSIVAYLTSLYAFQHEKEHEITQVWGPANIYKTRQAMNVASEKYLNNANEQLDYIGFGFRSLRNSKDNEIKELATKGVKIRFLVMNPNSTFVTEREKEEGTAPNEISHSIEQLKEWLKCVKTVASNPDNIQLRYYNASNLDFYHRVDNKIYVGPYWYGKQSQQTITYEFSAPSEGFALYEKYFNRLWNDSTLTEIVEL